MRPTPLQATIALFAAAAAFAACGGGSSGDAAGGGQDGGTLPGEGGGGEGGSSGGGPDGGPGSDASPPTTDGGLHRDASTTGTTAVSATDFLSSLGVCTHIGQGIDDPAKSATAMAYAGIRNLRDDGNAAHVQDWIAVHAQSGVKTCILTNQDVAATVDMAKKLNAAGALLAVEGPNEPNNFPVTYENQTSSYATTFLPVAHLQRDLYAAVKAEPTLAGIPVFHSSEAGGSEPDNVGLQFLKIPAGATTTMPAGTTYADFANTHNYVCGHSGKLVDNVAWNATDPTLNGDWDGMSVEYGKTWHGGFAGYSNADLPTVPRVTTETGWLTTGTGSITEEQQARVFLNLYLSGTKRSWRYTFIYMLRDDPGQGYWGLFDTSYAPKKSGTYLHNLTTILADTGPAPGDKLDYAVPSAPATVHDLLMQKSNGKFELAVWNDRTTGSDAVTVTLGGTFPTVAIYDPTVGATPTQTLTNVSTVPLTLSDHPVILEL